MRKPYMCCDTCVYGYGTDVDDQPCCSCVDGENYEKAYDVEDENEQDQRKPEDFIGNRKPEQEWISVKDRLPERGEDVLVYTLTHDVRKAHCYGDRSWFGHDGHWRVVTHWMPLPQPPKGE